MKPEPFTVLFVCMGNICRSPTAHGVFRHQVAAAGLSSQVVIDSAGTHGYHPGEPPDPRSQRAARSRDYDLADLRARQVHAADFSEADLILAMDWDNLALLEQRCPPEQRHKLRRLAEFCRHHAVEVIPDPYEQGLEGFERVLDLVEDACAGLLAHVRGRLSIKPAR